MGPQPIQAQSDKRTSGGSRQPRTAGFSLLEMVFVLVLLAIMATIGLGRVSGSSRHQSLTSAASRVAADLEFARQKALALGTAHKITFSPGTGTYTLNNVSDLNRPTQSYTVNLALPPYEVFVRQVDLDGAGGAVLTYDAYGKPVVSSALEQPPLKVVLGAGSRTAIIGINAITGRAYVEN